MSRGVPPRGVWLLAFALALFTSGCARRKRLLECNHFIKQTNASLEEINKYTNTSPKDPKLAANMHTLSKLFEQLAKDIDAMHISAPELAPETKRYRDMCEHSAAAARQLADAVSKDNPAEAKSAEAEFKRVVKDESDLIQRINKVCAR